MIAAVIPTRYNPPQLPVLLSVLLSDRVQPIVLRSEDYDHRIYRMWNAGVEKARIAGATEIAILNDDILIHQGTLPAMSEALRMENPRVEQRTGVVYPDVRADFDAGIQQPPLHRGRLEKTTGTWGAGGMTGFCFMFKSEIRLPFDEAYHWWYGDDAFEESVRNAGYDVARLVGVPIVHTGNGSASKRWAELAPLIEQDRARWDEHARWWNGMLAHYAETGKRRRE